MAVNAIQFQPGLSLAQFLRDYGTEAKCYRALYKSRWPHGFECSALAVIGVRDSGAKDACTTSAWPVVTR